VSTHNLIGLIVSALLLGYLRPGYETAQGNLRVYMGQLRRKLEPDPSRPRHLLNEPGMGYRFEP
jgi:two-component system KDP operon response regulator KdpE